MLFFVMAILISAWLYYQILHLSRIIPKNVFQTWHTKNLPKHMAKCVESVKKGNPDFTFYLFDDQDSREFIMANFDTDVLDAYDRLKPGAFKADLWRYCILYMYGGVYLDIKYYCEPGFRLNELVANRDITSTWIKECDPVKQVYTGLLVCEAKNTKLWKCITRIVENVRNREYGRCVTSPTGPDLLGGFFAEFEKSEIHLKYEEEPNVLTPHKLRGYIVDTLTNRRLLSHYMEYRQEQKEYANTGYWIDMWNARDIYADE